MRSPPAIVIDLGVTGLGTIRGLAAGEMEIHGLMTRRANSPGRLSRLCKKVDVSRLARDPSLLVDWLYGYARSLRRPPVVLPTGDAVALAIAAERDALSGVCHIWSNRRGALEPIVSKDMLYESARSAGINAPPTHEVRDRDGLVTWCSAHPPPYLIKPLYSDASHAAEVGKNRELGSASALLEFLGALDTRHLLVQQLLRGGDGRIYDCYGLCDREGRLLTMASHRRIRQLRPDFGTTTFGEIPACTGEAREERLFEVTERLLSKVRYHGIFGIEWLHDVDDDELYLLDFNARPFSSIGHLVDCGLNLPLAAYRELCGESPLGLQPRPPLRHGYWLDFNRDLESFAIKHTRGVLGWREWLATLSRARSFACFTLRDPGPGIYRLGQLAGVVARGVSKYVTRRLRRRFAPR